MAGIANAGRRDVLLTLLLGAVSIAAYLIYPVLNHGPGKIFLRTPLDRAIPPVNVLADGQRVSRAARSARSRRIRPRVLGCRAGSGRPGDA